MNVSVSGKIGKVSPRSRLEQTFKRLGLVSVSKEKVSFASLPRGALRPRLCPRRQHHCYMLTLNCVCRLTEEKEEEEEHLFANERLVARKGFSPSTLATVNTNNTC